MKKKITVVFLFISWIKLTKEKCYTQPSNLMKAFETIFGNRTYYKSCNTGDSQLCLRLTTESWILKSAGNFTVKECKEQFSDSHWGCQVSPRVRNLFEKVYRESAYLAALAGAELMKVVIMGCSEQFLETACNKKGLHCKEDLNYARRFVFDFFNLKDTVTDRRIKRFILKHNIKIGVKAFEKNVEKYCQNLNHPPFQEICCEVPKPFNVVVAELYKYYKSAYKYTKKLQHSWNRPAVNKKGLKNKYLVYLNEKRMKQDRKEKEKRCECKKG